MLAGTALTLSVPATAGADVLTTFSLSAANGDTVQTMSLGNTRLNGAALSNPSANLTTGGQTYYYVSTNFTPTVSGSYKFGQASASTDTVMLVYGGSFNPAAPAANAIVGNDDTAATNRPAGVSQTSTCGTINYCPQVTANLSGGTTYYVVISTYSPGNTSLTLANGEVIEFYVFGVAAVGGPGSGGTGTWSDRGAATGGSASGVGQALDAAGSSSLQGLVTQLSALPTESQDHALKQLGGTQLTPQLNLSGNITAPTVNAVEGRQGTVLGGPGASAGSPDLRAAVWGQFLGGRAVRDTSSGNSGYAASSFGLLFGADTEVADDVVAGAAVSWLRSVAHGKSDATGDRTQVDSYQFTGYGTWRPDGGAFHVQGLLGAGLNVYDQDRNIDFVGQTASASYNGMQYQAKIGVGYDVRLAPALTLTPLASLQVVRVENDGYTESGAGTANHTVDEQNFNSVQSELGAKLGYGLDTAWGRLSADTGAAWVHDYVHSPIATAASMGGAAFVTNTDRPAENGARLSLGTTLETADAISVRLEYNGELRSDYRSHVGLLTVRGEF